MKNNKLAMISILVVLGVVILVPIVDIPFFMDKISRGSSSLRENIISIAKVAIPLKDRFLSRTIVDKLARIHSTGACQFCDLTQSNMEGMDLKGIYLRYANLARANLYGTNLTGANLRGANLSGTTLLQANLSGTNLSGVDLSGKDLTGTNLSGVDLSGKDLSGTTLLQANLSGTNLSGVDLSGKDLTGTNLSGVDLSGKDLNGTNLTLANLNGANLTLANLNGANLTLANLRGVNLSRTNLSRANLSRTNLSRTNLSRTNLSRTNLSRTNLSESNLSEANLTEAIVAPYAPTNLETTSVGDDFISVTWTDNAHDELGYLVYISSGKKSNLPVATLAADVTSYTFDNLKSENHRIWIESVGRSLNSDVLMKIQGTIGSPPNPHKVDKSKGEWTLLVIPDTQNYVNQRHVAPLSNMADAFDWIVFIADDLNIKMVQGLGDITEYRDFKWEWENASEIYYKLEGKIPFAPNIGNHDDETTFKYYFPESRFVNEQWWGGNFNGIINSYQLMTIGNEDYLFVNIQCHLDTDCGKGFPEAKNWINSIIDSYPDRKVILATHDTKKRKGLKGNVRDQIISQHDNIVLTNAGHSIRETHFIENGPGGGVSNNFIVDFSGDKSQIMLLRYYVFKPSEDKVYFYTYSPITNEFEVDESSQGSFDLVQSDPF